MPTTTTAARKKATAARSATARAAKAPEDHQEKAKPDDGFVTVKVRGLDWKVAKDTMDDFELLDDLNALDQRDDATRMPSVLRRFLGDEQWTKAMDLLRDKTTKRVSISEGSAFVWELVEALNPNSSSS